MTVAVARSLLPALLALTTALIGGPALAQVRGTVGQSTDRLYDPGNADPGRMRSGTTGFDADPGLPARRSGNATPANPAELAGNSVVNSNTRVAVRKRTRSAATLTRPPNRAVIAPARPAQPVAGIAPPLAAPRAMPDIVAPGLTEPMVPRKKKKKEEDPYAPLGLRLGGLTVHAAVDLQAGYDSNPLRSGSGSAVKGSKFYQVAPEVSVVSDWSRHQLQFDLKGAYLLFQDVNDADRPTLDAKLTFRGDISRDTTLNLELKEKVDTQRPGSLDLTSAVKGRPAFYTHSGSIGVTQKFGYASITAAANVDRATYDQGVTYAGLSYDQSDRNYTTYGARLRGAYEITPGIVPYVEAMVDSRQYDREFNASGYRRSSDGVIGRVGTTFEVTQQLTGDVSAGYGMRRYDDSRLDHLSGLLIDASLVWQMSPLTKMTLKGTSEFVETATVGSSGAVNRKVSVDLAHDLLRNVTVTGSLGYSQTLYQGIGLMEQTINAGLKFDYKIDRTFVVRGSYAYERGLSDNAGQSYLAHVFLLGLRIQR
ncbi:MAG TPA: outer membrane beta-barrel protein [Beijerinckiaceae bacterium]|nr:outer membrane beta-barrel protein [Beijerinckiaceae bacterium]